MDKIKDKTELAVILRGEKERGKTVVLTNGCFDLLHHGHVELLESARSLGDILVVAVNTDESVRACKSPSRPITPLSERMEILEALEAVDYVVSFDEETPESLIGLLDPDVLVKGADWSEDRIVGADHVKGRGGRVHTIPLAKNVSTSAMIEKVLQGAAGRK